NIDAHEMNLGDFFSQNSLSDHALQTEAPGCIELGFGLFLYDSGQYEKSKRWCQQSWSIRLKRLGSEHPDTLTSADNLALVLRSQGNYKVAENMHRRAMEFRERVLGPEHPDRLTSMDNLGVVLENQGKFEMAKEMH